MKHLSISLPAITLALMLTIPGAKPAPIAATSTSPATATTSKDHRQIMYYWFTYPDDQYNDYMNVADEEWEWEMWLGGVSINQIPTGGTLLVKGYYDNSYPHDNVPAQFIYAHYVY